MSACQHGTYNECPLCSPDWFEDRVRELETSLAAAVERAEKAEFLHSVDHSMADNRGKVIDELGVKLAAACKEFVEMTADRDSWQKQSDMAREVVVDQSKELAAAREENKSLRAECQGLKERLMEVSNGWQLAVNAQVKAEEDLKWWAEVHEPEAIKLVTSTLESRLAEAEKARDWWQREADSQNTNRAYQLGLREKAEAELAGMREVLKDANQAFVDIDACTLDEDRSPAVIFKEISGIAIEMENKTAKFLSTPTPPAPSTERGKAIEDALDIVHGEMHGSCEDPDLSVGEQRCDRCKEISSLEDKLRALKSATKEGEA